MGRLVCIIVVINMVIIICIIVVIIRVINIIMVCINIVKHKYGNISMFNSASV